MILVIVKKKVKNPENVNINWMLNIGKMYTNSISFFHVTVLVRKVNKR